LNDLCFKLDSSGKELPEIKLPDYLEKISQEIDERYCMVVLFQGHFNRNFQPYDKIMNSLMTSSVTIKTPNSFGSTMRIVLFDIVNKYNALCGLICQRIF